MMPWYRNYAGNIIRKDDKILCIGKHTYTGGVLTIYDTEITTYREKLDIFLKEEKIVHKVFKDHIVLQCDDAFYAMIYSKFLTKTISFSNMTYSRVGQANDE